MKKRQGFTLLELMIVVVILGVLALIAVPSLLNAVDESRQSAVLGNVSAASSSIASRLAIGATVDAALIGELNATSENPYNSANPAFVFGGACGAGQVGVQVNAGTGEVTVDGCDGGGNQLTQKVLLPPATATINL